MAGQPNEWEQLLFGNGTTIDGLWKHSKAMGKFERDLLGILDVATRTIPIDDATVQQGALLGMITQDLVYAEATPEMLSHYINKCCEYGIDLTAPLLGKRGPQ